MKQILCSAIWFPEYPLASHNPKNIKEGLVLCGRRHHNIIANHKALTGAGIPSNHIQGFLTTDDEFVTREQALEIAIDAGQCWSQAEKRHSLTKLYSEDLY